MEKARTWIGTGLVADLAPQQAAWVLYKVARARFGLGGGVVVRPDRLENHFQGPSDTADIPTELILFLQALTVGVLGVDDCHPLVRVSAEVPLCDVVLKELVHIDVLGVVAESLQEDLLLHLVQAVQPEQVLKEVCAQTLAVLKAGKVFDANQYEASQTEGVDLVVVDVQAGLENAPANEDLLHCIFSSGRLHLLW